MIARDELVRRLDAGDVVVVDVRPAAEFAAGHIQGARSIPIDRLAEEVRTFPRDAEVVAYAEAASACSPSACSTTGGAGRAVWPTGSRVASRRTPSGQDADTMSLGTSRRDVCLLVGDRSHGDADTSSVSPTRTVPGAVTDAIIPKVPLWSARRVR